MVKSKKMSKTSIAVIVLSILLVLSMIMGLTGAWFTDKDSQAPAAPTSIQFGKVNITIADGSVAVSENENVVINKLVPGDGFALAGQVTDEADVEMYVYVEAKTEVTIAGKKYRTLYRTNTEGALTNSVIGVEALELVTSGASVADAAKWHLVGTVYASAAAETAGIAQGYLYRVEATAATANFAGQVTIAQETPNTVYGHELNADGTEKSAVETVYLNRNNEEVGTTDLHDNVQGQIEIGMKVWAIQSRTFNTAKAALDEMIALNSDLTLNISEGNNTYAAE